MYDLWCCYLLRIVSNPLSLAGYPYLDQRLRFPRFASWSGVLSWVLVFVHPVVWTQLVNVSTPCRSPWNDVDIDCSCANTFVTTAGTYRGCLLRLGPKYNA